MLCWCPAYYNVLEIGLDRQFMTSQWPFWSIVVFTFSPIFREVSFARQVITDHWSDLGVMCIVFYTANAIDLSVLFTFHCVALGRLIFQALARVSLQWQGEARAIIHGSPKHHKQLCPFRLRAHNPRCFCTAVGERMWPDKTVCPGSIHFW